MKEEKKSKKKENKKHGHPNNKHSKKWTEEKANEFFKKLLKEVEKDKTIFSIAQAALKAGRYENLVYYLKDTYPNTDLEPLKKVESIIKSRLMICGLGVDHKDYVPVKSSAMAIFLLKANWGLSDQKNSALDDIVNSSKDNEITEVTINFKDASKKEDTNNKTK